jgi:predicted ester cyclase
MSEENQALARRFLEAPARGDLNTLDELMAPDFVDRSVLPGQGSTREDYKRSVVEMLSAFSNSSLTVESQIAEGDLVVSRITGRSIHRGTFLGVAPTGEETTYTAIHIHRIVGGKIVEEWSQLSSKRFVCASASSRSLGSPASSSRPSFPKPSQS